MEKSYFENVKSAEVTVYPERLKEKGISQIQAFVRKYVSHAIVSVSGDTIIVNSNGVDELAVGTATGGAIQIAANFTEAGNGRAESILNAGYNYVKKVVVDGEVVWTNRDETEAK